MCLRWVEFFCLTRESLFIVFPQVSPVDHVVSNFGNKLFVKDFVGLFVAAAVVVVSFIFCV